MRAIPASSRRNPSSVSDVSPAVVPISSFEPRANTTVIERALPPPVSCYLHLGNMRKSCLRGFPLWSIVWLLCECVCARALNRFDNSSKDSCPDNSKLQTPIIFCEASSFCSSSLVPIYSQRSKVMLRCCVARFPAPSSRCTAVLQRWKFLCFYSLLFSCSSLEAAVIDWWISRERKNIYIYIYVSGLTAITTW